MRFLLTILCLLQFAYGLNVKTVADLKKYTGTATYITVTDWLEGDDFYPYTGTQKADGGVIVPDGKGRLWKRNYNLALGVWPQWWGARPDDNKDDLAAFNSAINYITNNYSFGEKEIYHRDFFNCPLGGFYEVSDTWRIGGQSITASNAIWHQATPLAPSFNIDEHLKSARTLPISLKFSDRAYIIGNFTPKELTPIVVYSCYGYQYGGLAAQVSTIEGLKVVGRGGLNMYEVGRDNKQAGLLTIGGINLNIKNCYFYNLQEGFIHNMTYKTMLSNINFGNCGRGFLTIGSHGSRGEGVFSDHCDIGIEIYSGATNWTANTEQCPRGIIVGTSNVKVSGGYFEQLDNTSKENDYQLTIGYPPTHPFGQQQRLHSIIVDVPAIAGLNSVLVESNVDDVTITGTIYGYNVYRDVSTKIKSEKTDWILKP